MTMYLIFLAYLALCAIVSYRYRDEHNDFMKMMWLTFFLSPMGGIIMGLRNRADKKLRSRSFTLRGTHQ